METEPPDNQTQHTKLTGIVEHVIFHNPENGFCVLKVQTEKHAHSIIITGNIPDITAEEHIECQGNWVKTKNYGHQLQTHYLTTITPTTLQGIEKYLASGLVEGIGKYHAKQLINTFGAEVFTIIENHPERLKTIKGIGKKRIKKITASLEKQKTIRELVMFLQTHKIGTQRAAAIYKTYGEQALAKIRHNPYRLAVEIPGIGFKIADEIAKQLGIANDALIRAQAGIHYSLQRFTQDGHCAILQTELVKQTAELLQIPEEIVLIALAEERKTNKIIIEEANNQPCVYLKSIFIAEKLTAEQLTRLRRNQSRAKPIDLERSLPKIEAKTNLILSPSQRQAVALIIQSKVAIITGGPGVGKTTVINTILKLMRQRGDQVMLCAPTGRAAKRLAESTGMEAKTIHRLLEYDPITHHFNYGLEKPLATDTVIVDEMSMVDISLMSHLLNAIPDDANLIMVGDVDQLPSVGPGAVLADMIHSQTIPTARLTEIFRQAKTSTIVINAHRINQGQPPILPEASPELQDFYFIPAHSPEQIHTNLMRAISERIPQRFQLNPLHDIQVLSPMHRGLTGVSQLNHDLQALLNPHAEPKIERHGHTFAKGDKVIQMSNNYDKDVFNGDIGFIADIHHKEQQLRIVFDERSVNYDFNELDDLALAYATTIHKSQGSEYPAVIIPLSLQHYIMLERNLLYTAITRGKQLVLIIGDPKALTMAINNIRATQRQTRLAERLSQFQ